MATAIPKFDAIRRDQPCSQKSGSETSLKKAGEKNCCEEEHPYGWAVTAGSFIIHHNVFGLQ
jgi:hypothetical protein